MISARELRIMNMFMPKVANTKPCFVASIFRENSEYWIEDYDGYCYRESEIEGVQITNEILNMMVFEAISGAHRVHRRNVVCNKGEQNEKVFDIEFHDPECWYSDTKFMHVHQLQNLFWCLCGKELELKPATGKEI